MADATGCSTVSKGISLWQNGSGSARKGSVSFSLSMKGGRSLSVGTEKPRAAHR